MKIRVKDIGVSSGGPFICVINERDSNKLDLHALDRIKIKHFRNDITAVVDISEHVRGIKNGYLGLFEEPFSALKLKNNDYVDIYLEKKPTSIDFIKKKLDNKKLTKQEINEIIKDIVDNKLTETELAYFVAGCYKNGLSDDETFYLTESIVNNGKKLSLNKKIIVDKHCTGGIPNNRTTLIIVPIIAASGLSIPKTSSTKG